MKPQDWKRFWILYAIGCCSGIFHLSYGVGFAVGGLVAFILYKQDERYVDRFFKRENPSAGRRKLGHLLLMSVVLVLAAWKNMYCNIFAVAIGICLVKITLFVGIPFERRETNDR